MNVLAGLALTIGSCTMIFLALAIGMGVAKSKQMIMEALRDEFPYFKDPTQRQKEQLRLRLRMLLCGFLFTPILLSLGWLKPDQISGDGAVLHLWTSLAAGPLIVTYAWFRSGPSVRHALNNRERYQGWLW